MMTILIATFRYSTMEKELLAIIVTLSEFRSMLLSAQLHVYTDHKNLMYTNLNNSRVIRWRLFLEEFHAQYHYIEGKHNVLGDAFSRLPRMEYSARSEGKSYPKSTAVDEESLFVSVLDDDDLLECFVNLPEANAMRNPLDLAWILENQFDDQVLNQRRAE